MCRRFASSMSFFIVLLDQTTHTLFQIYDEKFETSITADVESISESFQHFQELVGLLTRYAVMENLYNQNAALTLTPSYETDLQDLCATILRYNGHAIFIASGVGKWDSESAQGGREGGETLIGEIIEKDKVCRAVRVVLESDEDSDVESEDAEVEDVDDGRQDVLATWTTPDG